MLTPEEIEAFIRLARRDLDRALAQMDARPTLERLQLDLLLDALAAGESTSRAIEEAGRLGEALSGGPGDE
jgi:hypothetical protein